MHRKIKNIITVLIIIAIVISTVFGGVDFSFFNGIDLIREVKAKNLEDIQELSTKYRAIKEDEDGNKYATDLTLEIGDSEVLYTAGTVKNKTLLIYRNLETVVNYGDSKEEFESVWGPNTGALWCIHYLGFSFAGVMEESSENVLEQYESMNTYPYSYDKISQIIQYKVNVTGQDRDINNNNKIGDGFDKQLYLICLKFENGNSCNRLYSFKHDKYPTRFQDYIRQQDYRVRYADLASYDGVDKSSPEWNWNVDGGMVIETTKTGPLYPIREAYYDDMSGNEQTVVSSVGYNNNLPSKYEVESEYGTFGKKYCCGTIEGLESDDNTYSFLDADMSLTISNDISDLPEQYEGKTEDIDNIVGVYYPVKNVKTKYNPPMRSVNQATFETSLSIHDFINSSDYNFNLAKTSLAAASASMGKTDSNIKDMMTNQLNLRDYIYGKYDNDGGTDNFNRTDNSVAFSMGYTKFKYKRSPYSYEREYNVVMINIRSGEYGGEWYSNGQVGTETEHKGFSDAAEQVSNEFLAYMGDSRYRDFDQSNTIVWITGFSRGGAVANLVAKKLVSKMCVSSDLLHCYTFATPRTTRSPANIQGIYNTIDPVDLVTMVPFKDWGYERYGQDMVLPLRQKNSLLYNTLFDDAKKNYKKITSGGKITKQFLETSTSQRLCRNLKQIFESSDNYAMKYQNDISALLNQTLGAGSMLSSVTVLSLINAYVKMQIQNGSYDLGGQLLLQAKIIRMLYSGIGLAVDLTEFRPLAHHDPELYMSWLMTGVIEQGNKYINYSTDEGVSVYDDEQLKANLEKVGPEIKKQLEIMINSKSIAGLASISNIDNSDSRIEIYNSANTKVADIEGDDVYSFIEENPEIALETYIDENDVIHISIPAYETYSVNISGKGNYNYAILEYSGDDLIKKVMYRNIILSDNDTLNAEIKEGYNYSSENYNPKKNSESSVDIFKEINGENEVFNIDVTTEGEGIAIGYGQFAYEDSVVLYAAPSSSDVEFLGWYEGNTCVSKEQLYGFFATSDRTIEAKFIESQPEEQSTEDPGNPIEGTSGEEKTTEQFTDEPTETQLIQDESISIIDETTSIVEESVSMIEETKITTDELTSHSDESIQPEESVSEITTQALESKDIHPIAKPGKVKIKKARRSLKKLKITLGLMKSTRGYQIAIYRTKRYAINNKKAIIKTIRDRNKTGKYIVKLGKFKKEKILYIKARAYVLDGKTKKFGTWSDVKSVKMKK